LLLIALDFKWLLFTQREQNERLDGVLTQDQSQKKAICKNAKFSFDEKTLKGKGERFFFFNEIRAPMRMKFLNEMKFFSLKCFRQCKFQFH
jgi:hypothetical protein